MKRNTVILKTISLILIITAFGLVISPLLEMESALFIGLLMSGVILTILDDIKNKKHENIIPIIIEIIFLAIVFVFALLFIFK